MIEPSLNQLEREVEASRTKLASDLSTLRSPEFTENLKQEAIDYRDALLDKAKAKYSRTRVRFDVPLNGSSIKPKS